MYTLNALSALLLHPLSQRCFKILLTRCLPKPLTFWLMWGECTQDVSVIPQSLYYYTSFNQWNGNGNGIDHMIAMGKKKIVFSVSITQFVIMSYFSVTKIYRKDIHWQSGSIPDVDTLVLELFWPFKMPIFSVQSINFKFVKLLIPSTGEQKEKPTNPFFSAVMYVFVKQKCLICLDVSMTYSTLFSFQVWEI